MNATIPQLVVRVGFTGHRVLAGVDFQVLEQRLLECFAKLHAEAATLAQRHPNVFASAAPKLQLVTGLAVGSDQCAARAAIEAKFDLVALSPFAWGEFERDFDGDAPGLAEARRLFRAARDETVELDASLVRSGSDANTRFSQGAASYARLGRFLVAQSDVLVAVVDGRRPDSPEGGARWVLHQARRQGLQCIEIDVAKSAHQWLPTASELAGMLALAVGPPTSVEAGAHGGHTAHHGHADRSTTLVGDYYLEPSPKDGVSALARVYARCFDDVVKWCGGRPSEAKREHEDPVSATRAQVASAAEPTVLEKEQERADQLAGHYNGLYRTSYALLSMLGFLAVLAAVLGHLVPHEPERIQPPNAPAHAVAATGEPNEQQQNPAVRSVPAHEGRHWSALTIAELVILLAIFGIYYSTKRLRLREKGTDYRLLAELLRVAKGLHPLRARLRRRPTRAHGSDGDVAQSWMAWYATAIERMQGIGKVRFDTPTIEVLRGAYVHDVIADQRRFHRVRSHRYATIERRIHRIVFVLFAGAFTGCVAHLMHWKLLEPYGLVLTAALPALAAALHTIATQAEMARLERRYRAMERYFANAQLAVERLPAGDLAHLEDIAQEVGARMVDEVAEWRWLHSVHEPRL